MDYDERIEHNIFQELSTNRNDYRVFPKQERKIYNWPKDTSEPPPKKLPARVPRDNETFQAYRKGKHVPFDLLWEPWPIIGTDPRTRFKLREKPVDTGKEECIKTRPRLYISPAISMDDVEEKAMRDMLCKVMYTTEWRRAEQEAVAYVKYTTPEIGDTILEPGEKRLKMKIDPHPPLPGGWSSMGKTWDYNQRRATVDSTKSFWLHRDLNYFDTAKYLEERIPKETKQEISALIEKDKLRMPHDRHAPGYTGFKPDIPNVVGLPKSDFPVTHPLLSVAQAVTKRYDKDTN